SDREVRSVLPIGGSRVARLRKMLKSGIEVFHTRRPVQTPWHAFDTIVLEAFKAHCSTWILEDGFPCPHRLPRQYFTEPNLTWRTVHARYVDDTSRAYPNTRTMSYERFTQYVHFHFAGVRLTRTKVDECDCCVRLDIMLQNTDLTAEERDSIDKEKRTHIDEAIAQRRFVS
ncbi:Cleavage inducible protein, partial [Phytophthora megakarya]